MSVFLDLPDELCIEFLSEWIDFKALSRLDSSLCSRLSTTLLPRVHVNDYLSSSLKAIRWLISKAIIVKSLILNRSYGRKGYDFINTCTKLQSLQIQCTLDMNRLDGRIFHNLTHLSLIYFESETIIMLKYIHLHCRLLKSFTYVHLPSENASRILVEIINTNELLVTVTFQVDTFLVQELATHCAHKLNSINVLGYPEDSTSMIHLLKTFDGIDCIGILVNEDLTNEPYVLYKKSKHSLEIYWELVDSEWTDFVDEIPDLLEVKLRGGVNWGLDFNIAFKSVVTIWIDSEFVTEYNLNTLLSNCTALKTFGCSVWHSINWALAMNKSNAIEEVIIESFGCHLISLLAACRHLKKMTLRRCSMPLQKVLPLMDAIRSYKHIDTGLSLKCYCDFEIKQDEHGHYHLSYDGSQFSGTLKDNFSRLLMEAFTREKDEKIKYVRNFLGAVVHEIEALIANAEDLERTLKSWNQTWNN